MSDRQIFRLPVERAEAAAAMARAPDGYQVLIRPAKRSLDQNAKFHALCQDVAESGFVYNGRARTADEWKFLFVSGHAVATNQPGELLLGLENERVMLRESTASMSKERGSSLIEYTIAWATSHGIQLREPAP